MATRAKLKPNSRTANSKPLLRHSAGTSKSSKPPALPSILLKPVNRERLKAILDREIARLEAEEQIQVAEEAFRKEQGEFASFERERQACAADILHWFNHWAWTYDPRLIARGERPYLPFKPWPKQAECLIFVDERVRAGEPW